MTNILGIVVSLVYIAIIMAIASFCYQKKQFSIEDSRKFVHVGLSNWWLIAMLFFDNWIWASILPACFIVINLLNLKFNFIKGIERPKTQKSLGTVYYCIALTILAVVLFRTEQLKYIGAIAVLILGYADGIGGLISEYLGKHEFGFGHKSAEGSFAVFTISFVISYVLFNMLLYSDLALEYSFFIACFATMIELFSIGGIDNLTLPLGTALVTYMLIREPLFTKFSLAFAISGLVVWVALLNRMLSYAGGISAMVLGVIMFYYDGPVAALAVIFFFLTSAILEHYHNIPKEEKVKSFVQVMENAIPFIMFGLMYYGTNSEVALVCLYTAIAGACSDTWGSGIGYYSKEKVLNVLTFKPIKKGESGGITMLGTFGEFLGALAIALMSLLLGGKNMVARALIILVFGFFTAYLDSIFGILLQVKYYNKKTGDLKETKPKDMTGYEKISGYGFIDNSMVNFLTIMISSLLAGMLAFLVF